MMTPPWRAVLGEPLADLADDGVAVAEREQLLELVDDHDRTRPRRARERGDRGERIGAGHEDDHVATTTAQRRDVSRAQQRRLPAPGGPGDQQQRRGLEPVEASLDLGLAAEELVGVGLLVGRQPLVRARLDPGARLDRCVQGGILAQDLRLEGRQLGPASMRPISPTLTASASSA
jgi:hypothetical protein